MKRQSGNQGIGKSGNSPLLKGVRGLLSLATRSSLLATLIICVIGVICGSAYAGNWPSFSNGGGSDWTTGYYRPISITNSTGAALTDYQVAITLTTAALGNPYTHIKADGSDIRFTQSDKQTEITNYWIKSWNNAGNSVIWVKMPNLPVGDSYIYMYYGNLSATSSATTLVGTDHGGADWAPANGSSIDGVHYNIGTFTIAAGTTVYVTAYDGVNYGRLEVYANNAAIAGTLEASGRGYPGSSGPGAGSAGTMYTLGAGGGGYGGAGSAGGAAGGGIYGSVTTPDDLGSGGGNAKVGGGAGAGLIKLYISGILTINGVINAIGNGGSNGGSPAFGSSGGGAGGTIFISTGTLAGSGSITANGGPGAGGTYPSGGGGGGRIASYYSTKTYTGTFSVSGGIHGNGSTGNAGTILVALQPSVAAPGAEYDYMVTTGLTAVQVGGEVILRWNDVIYVPDETGYMIERKIGAGGIYAQIGQTGTDMVAYADSAISGNTTYYYRVKAYIASGVRNPSNEVNVTTGIINGIIVTTTNWTGLIPAGSRVTMGQAIAQVKFTMAATGTTTAHWKRFRVDKYARAGQQLIPDDKIVVQVWMENNGDGLFDANDQMIVQGTFTNNTCYLNMDRRVIDVTPHTYYIVYKYDANCGGGQFAGVNITDSSYLEFDDALCIGVPP